jgi:hypothetical protein
MDRGADDATRKLVVRAQAISLIEQALRCCDEIGDDGVACYLQFGLDMLIERQEAAGANVPGSSTAH